MSDAAARTTWKTPPSRRFWAYVGCLVGALGLLSVGAKLHKAVRASQELSGGSIGDSATQLIASDVLFVGIWGVFWTISLHLARGRVRTGVAAAMQLATAGLLFFLVVEHAFFLVTGTQLDWALLVYSASHAERLSKVVSSEISAAWWAAGAVAVSIAALPWRIRPLGAPAQSDGNWKPTVWTLTALLVLIASVHVSANGQTVPAQLQPLRTSTLTTHLQDALQWASGRDDAADRKQSPRPTDPLVVVKTDRTRPLNVVLITLESVRAQSLTPYNAKLKTTPNLAKLAMRGAVFESAYTLVPHTTKSLIPLHCGIPPKLTHYFEEATSGGLPTDCLAKVLTRHGWATHYFQTPESLFERRRDLVTAFGFSDLTADETLPKAGFEHAGYFGFEDDVLLGPTLAWVDKHKAAHPKQPFFLGMLNVTTHHPYTVPSSFNSQDWGLSGKNSKHLSKYYDTLHYVDRFLGKLFAGFDERGLGDNTIFVIVGDHGEAFGEHGLFQHGHTMHEEGLRVPLLVIGPGVKPGTRHGGLRQHVDVMPTLLELLGLRVAAGALPGRSLLRTDGHERLFYACWRKDTCRAMRTKNRKIIHHMGRRDDEAYDLANDPGERHDLVAAGKVSKAELAQAKTDMQAWSDGVTRRYEGQSIRRRNPWVSRKRPENLGTKTDIVFDDWVRMIGYSVEKTTLKDGDATWVTTHFEVLKKPPADALIWLHAVGPIVGGKRKRRVADHVPVEGSYPMSDWKVGEFITDRHWLRMKPGHPSGTYDVFFGFYQPKAKRRARPTGTGVQRTTSNGLHLAALQMTRRTDKPRPNGGALARLSSRQRARIWPSDSVRAIPLPGGATATIGEVAKLIGVKAGPRALKADETGTWTVFFDMLRDMPRWTGGFVHVTGPLPSTKLRRNLGMNPFGHDLPVHKWKKGWRLAIDLELTMRRHHPPGDYDVWFGLWDPNLQRPNQRHAIRSGHRAANDRMHIGRFRLIPSKAPPPRPRRGSP
ncbi:MAG: sulfatase [Myxococcales bacterium]|nr:sulfatase [Myxococcales bacterium]